MQSVLTTIPDENLQIIIMTNTGNPEVWPNEVADRIIEIMIED